MNAFCKIRELYLSLAQFEQEFESIYNISLNEGMLLCILSDNQKKSAGEISKALGLHHSNSSKIIKSVESKQFINRVIGDTDKRQMFFTITQAGLEKLESIKIEKIKIPDIIKNLI